ncbi:MAG: 50S ribosomal protein L2 [Candidatus Moraniibacteriota bacterium]|nr:MAG: 50S ribosomal protein L2 [Candidatus Moranbacteria bacterium]
MAIKVYKRNHAGRRNMSIVKPDAVTDKAPEKALCVSLNRKAGRANGKISVRHRQVGAKKLYRMVDFKMDKWDIPGKIAAIEKDPNRSALIALVVYADGEKRYVLATEGMRVGMTIISGENAPIEEGNRTKLKNIISGTFVSNIEMKRNAGGQIIRSAGSSALVMSVDEKHAQLKMPSGEIRLIDNECYATIGAMSNFEHSATKIGKAGRARYKGKRPAVRGSAMNPVDHPHGGGEGTQPIGLKYPKTPWGRPALGVRTRRKGKSSDKMIIKSRHKK